MVRHVYSIGLLLSNRDTYYSTNVYVTVTMILQIVIILFFRGEIIASNFGILEFHPTNTVEEPIYKSEGDNATLSCQVNSYYDSCLWVHRHEELERHCKVTYTWEWDEVKAHYKKEPYKERVCPTDRLRIPEDLLYRNCILIIGDIQAKDHGEWTCIVRDWEMGLEAAHRFNLVLVG